MCIEVMCRFANRCENFYPDNDNARQCLLLCQKNPLALAIALMPDRYVEKDLSYENVDNKVVNMTKEVPEKATRKEVMDEEYEEMVTATQDLDNEVIEFEFDPEGDIASKLSVPTNDIDTLIKKTAKSRNSTILDEKVSQAIEDNIQDNEPVEVHPLDDINFEPVERTAVADQPNQPKNAEVYIKTRERGRPKMTNEQKEVAKVKRDKEKAILEKEREQELLASREAMKKKVAKKKADKEKARKKK